jgi:SAM-dependent methyltransferase
VNSGESIRYQAPWTSVHDVAKGSLDLIFSQAVLEHVDALEEAYRAMFVWLKPGGYASHVIDCGAHHISPLWNGHWAYSEREWRLVRGQREFLLNREPLSTHLAFAQRVGFDTLLVQRDYDNQGLHVGALSKRFRELDEEDRRTRVAMLILRKRFTN